MRRVAFARVRELPEQAKLLVMAIRGSYCLTKVARATIGVSEEFVITGMGKPGLIPCSAMIECWSDVSAYICSAMDASHNIIIIITSR